MSSPVAEEGVSEASSKFRMSKVRYLGVILVEEAEGEGEGDMVVVDENSDDAEVDWKEVEDDLKPSANMRRMIEGAYLSTSSTAAFRRLPS